MDEFIENLCDILEIEKPKVSYDTSHFISDTMMAQCDSKGEEIFIKHMERPNPDYIFSIVHELRHVWQMQKDKDFYFANYRGRDVLDVEAYNNQIAELDANAFAYFIMRKWFGLKPLFNGLPSQLMKRIEKYAQINFFEDKTWKMKIGTQ